MLNSQHTDDGPQYGPNHNFLAACAATIQERFAKAKGASKATLDDLQVVGERLNEAKGCLNETKGAFGEWCEAFPFDRAWRARLMKLAANWEEIMQAVHEVEGEDRKTWSVDGVLSIWAKWKRAKEAPEQDAEEAHEGHEGEHKAKARKETEAERLRRELAEALERIRALEAELAKSRKAHEEPKAKAKPEGEPKAKPSGANVNVDPATKTRARKVWGLYTKGATDGEKQAARSRLEEMAARFSATFDDFVAACGLAA